MMRAQRRMPKAKAARKLAGKTATRKVATRKTAKRATSSIRKTAARAVTRRKTAPKRQQDNATKFLDATNNLRDAARLLEAIHYEDQAKALWDELPIEAFVQAARASELIVKMLQRHLGGDFRFIHEEGIGCMWFVSEDHPAAEMLRAAQARE